MGPTLGGGTQDTDFNKGFTKGIFTKSMNKGFNGFVSEIVDFSSNKSGGGYKLGFIA